MPNLRLFIIPTVCLGLIAAAPVEGAWGAEPPRACAMEPRAHQVLHDALAYLGAAKQFSFKLEGSRDQIQADGRKIQFGSCDTMAVRRPNGLRMDSSNDAGEFSAWYDGKRFTLINRKDRTYYSAPMPDSIDGCLASLGKEHLFSFPLDYLIRTDAVEKVCDGALGGFEAGLHKVGGVECHHVVLMGDAVDAEMWIDAGVLPLIRKIALTFKKQPGSPSFDCVISDWDFSTQIPDSAFAPPLPKGAVLRPIAELGGRSKSGPTPGVKP